jgi:hypothetical protein
MMMGFLTLSSALPEQEAGGKAVARMVVYEAVMHN